MKKSLLLFLFILFAGKTGFSQHDSLKAPDAINPVSVPGYYTRDDKKSSHFSFMQDGRFIQSGWPRKGSWALRNDTIFCRGEIPFYNLHRYTLGTDHINWKMIIVNGELFKIKKLLNSEEYRIPKGYSRKKV